MPHEPEAGGTLKKTSLAKLQAIAKKTTDATATMEEQLACASVSPYIAPALVEKLTGVKNSFVAGASAVNLYTERNVEDGTAQKLQDAKSQLNAANNEFAVLTKMLKVAGASAPPKTGVTPDDTDPESC